MERSIITIHLHRNCRTLVGCVHSHRRTFFINYNRNLLSSNSNSSSHRNFHEIRYRVSGVERVPEAVVHKLDTYLFSVELCRRDTMDFSHCCAPIHQFEHPQRSRLMNHCCCSLLKRIVCRVFLSSSSSRFKPKDQKDIECAVTAFDAKRTHHHHFTNSHWTFDGL